MKHSLQSKSKKLVMILAALTLFYSKSDDAA